MNHLGSRNGNRAIKTMSINTRLDPTSRLDGSSLKMEFCWQVGQTDICLHYHSSAVHIIIIYSAITFAS